MHLMIFGFGILPPEHSTLHKLLEHLAKDPFGKLKCSKTGPQSVRGPKARPPASFTTSGVPSEMMRFGKDEIKGRVSGSFGKEGVFGGIFFSVGFFDELQ